MTSSSRRSSRSGREAERGSHPGEAKRDTGVRRIGIDVGGTNTDAVLLDADQVVHAVKTPTTADVTTGVTHARSGCSCSRADPGAAVDAVMIGTTHFTNAVVQRRHLAPVAAIRIGLPASASLPPFVDWPEDLARIVCGQVHMLEGGHEYDGRSLVPFDVAGMRAAARAIRDAGLRSVGIASIFSPLDGSCEEQAAEILREICPGVSITLSHHLGRIGLLERENVALLNACLRDLARATTAGPRGGARDQRHPRASLPDAERWHGDAGLRGGGVPGVRLCLRPDQQHAGRAFLSKLDDAIVVDVGGTTTDIGSLQRGFPREANNVVEVGGVRTLFRMPDLLSLGLGGGSLVRDEPLAVGPLSVGYELLERGLVFGGSELTATDIAVAAGLVDLGDRRRVAALPADLVRRALACVHAMIEEGVDRMKSDARDVPLVAVGEAPSSSRSASPGVSEIVQVPHQAVANAVGAAIAQVSGEVDRIFQTLSREEAIAEAKRLADEKAVRAGADARTLGVVEVEDLPIAYLPGNALRVRVRVVGDIAATATRR